MLITDKGVLVRTRVSEIRELGRATQGVTLIALDDGAKLSGLQRIVENDANGTTMAPTAAVVMARTPATQRQDRPCRQGDPMMSQEPAAGPAGWHCRRQLGPGPGRPTGRRPRRTWWPRCCSCSNRASRRGPRTWSSSRRADDAAGRATRCSNACAADKREAVWQGDPGRCASTRPTRSRSCVIGPPSWRLHHRGRARRALHRRRTAAAHRHPRVARQPQVPVGWRGTCSACWREAGGEVRADVEPAHADLRAVGWPRWASSRRERASGAPK
jgi:hypothetical protein